MPVLPSIDDVKTLARSALANQADEPYEFGRIMRRLIPQIVVRPFRLCDGGGIVLRASLTLNLAGLLLAPQRHPEVAAHLQRELVVDLFDPPQRAAFLEQVVTLRNAGLTENEVARRLGITKTAAQRAMALDRLMRQQNLEDPYVPVTAPSEDMSKLRRHRHPRYEFRPFTNQS